MREAAWQGRSEGFDNNRASDVDLVRESLRLRKKNTKELPPLIDNGPSPTPAAGVNPNEFANFSLDPAVGSSNNGNNGNAAAIGGAGGGTSGKGGKEPGKKRAMSETQMRLMNR